MPSLPFRLFFLALVSLEAASLYCRGPRCCMSASFLASPITQASGGVAVELCAPILRLLAPRPSVFLAEFHTLPHLDLGVFSLCCGAVPLLWSLSRSPIVRLLSRGLLTFHPDCEPPGCGLCHLVQFSHTAHHACICLPKLTAAIRSPGFGLCHIGFCFVGWR